MTSGIALKFFTMRFLNVVTWFFVFPTTPYSLQDFKNAMLGLSSRDVDEGVARSA